VRAGHFGSQKHRREPKNNLRFRQARHRCSNSTPSPTRHGVVCFESGEWGSNRKGSKRCQYPHSRTVQQAGISLLLPDRLPQLSKPSASASRERRGNRTSASKSFRLGPPTPSGRIIQTHFHISSLDTPASTQRQDSVNPKLLGFSVVVRRRGYDILALLLVHPLLHLHSSSSLLSSFHQEASHES